MKFITDKIEWTPAMKEYSEELAQKRLSRLVKDPSGLTIRLMKINDQKIKISLDMGDFRAQSVKPTYYEAASDAFSTLKGLISKYKDKYIKHKHSFASTLKGKLNPENNNDNDNDNLITKEKVFNLEPITIDQAIQHFEATDYQYYVFRDIDDANQISIIYRRFDETYGLIRCR